MYASYLIRGQLIHQMHRDVVFDVPSGLQNVGSSPRCAVQGFYMPGRLVSVQGHPEFNEDIITKIIRMRRSQHIFDGDVADDGLARAPLKHDGLSISIVFWEFLVK